MDNKTNNYNKTNNRTSNYNNTSVYCDVFIVNSYGNVKCFHRRVPQDHVKWLECASHLTVKIVKTYKVDNSYRNRKRRQFKKSENQSDEK